MRTSAVRTAAPPSINNPAGERKNRLSDYTLTGAAARRRPRKTSGRIRGLGTVPPAALSPLTEQQGELARQYDEEEEA